MKTITEFLGNRLTDATQRISEWTTAGKTPEEIAPLMTETFKLEGEKLALFHAALEAVKGRLLGLKRVVAVSFAEGEKTPTGIKQVGTHYFSIEYFPGTQREAQKDDGRRDGRRGGGRDGDRKGGRPGRGEKRGDKRGDGNRDNNRGRPNRDASVPGEGRREFQPRTPSGPPRITPVNGETIQLSSRPAEPGASPNSAPKQARPPRARRPAGPRPEGQGPRTPRPPRPAAPKKEPIVIDPNQPRMIITRTADKKLSTEWGIPKAPPAVVESAAQPAALASSPAAAPSDSSSSS